MLHNKLLPSQLLYHTEKFVEFSPLIHLWHERLKFAPLLRCTRCNYWVSSITTSLSISDIICFAHKYIEVNGVAWGKKDLTVFLSDNVEHIHRCHVQLRTKLVDLCLFLTIWSKFCKKGKIRHWSRGQLQSFTCRFYNLQFQVTFALLPE